MAKDYYKILGISRDASKEEVKKAYRAQAHKHHPDKSGGDEARFKEVNEAYQVLGDDNKRAQYDQYGQVFEGGGRGGAGFGGQSPWGDANFDFGDIFEGVFGGAARGGGRRVRRGNDIAVDTELTFSESVFGVERHVTLNKMNACARCKGAGNEEGSGKKKCDKCQGSGTVKQTQRTFLGTFQQLVECDICRGVGEAPEKPCRECRGTGVAKSESEIVLKIPAGIDNGETLRMSGAGEAAAHGVPGDLYIKVHVRPHKIFHREGVDLTMKMDISFAEAALGGEREVETLDGNIKVKIPAGVDSHETLRVRGKGVPHGGTRGDLLIKLILRTPKKLSPRSRELLDELKKEGV